MPSLPRSVIVAVIVAGALVAGPGQARAVTGSECGGVVFRDLDGDGRRVETLERDGRADDVEAGVAGVLVTVVDVRQRVTNTSTRRDGAWTVDLGPTDYPIRVEFAIPDGYEAGRPGPDGATSVQHLASASECGQRSLGNLGIYPITEFCDARPELAVACHVPAGATDRASQPAIRAVSSAVVDDGETGATGIEGRLDPTTRTLATQGQIGTVYGQAARRDGTIFAAAFTKRHTQSTSDLNPSGNPTVIYRIPPDDAPEVFVTVDPDATNPHDAAAGDTRDLGAMDAVFTTGLGDIELSPDESTLYAVDLGRRELVAIDVGSGTILARHRLDGPALGRSDCAVTPTDRFGDLRPFGLGWSGDRLIVGVVCSAASTVSERRMVAERGDPGPGAGDHGSLVGYVYRFTSGSFTELLAWPLAGDRGETHSNELMSNEAIWHPWTADYPFDAEHHVVSYPQPAITDIAVDGRGELVIALADRWSHQTAAETDAPARDGSTRRITETVAAGDLQRACRRSTGYVIEGTPGCSGGFGNGWEFFDGESYGWQAETALGSVVRLPGRDEVIATQMNPIPEDHAWSSGGLVWHSVDDGERRIGARLYDRETSPPGSTFENASGLGDLATLCGRPDPSVGGSVWHDLDGDGRRVPTDPPVAGVAIELVDESGEIVAVDHTDERGAYAFSAVNVQGGLIDGAQYNVVMAATNYLTGRGVLVGRNAHTGLVPTAADVGERDDLDSDAQLREPVAGERPLAVIAVSAGDDPATPQRESTSVHNYDFGLRDRYDLAVDTSAGPAMREAGNVAFRIEVRNEGSLPSGPFEMRANLPEETSLTAPRVGPLMPTSIGAGSITWSFDDAGSIPPGDTRAIDVVMHVNDPSITSIEHTVEIVADSGRDEDSDPGLNWDEDDEDRLVVDLFGIAGSIWVDVASDESERVERPATGVVVQVLADDGVVVGGTTTDGSGRFLFDSFPAGGYRIAIPASEFEPGRPLRGFDQAIGGSSGNVDRMLSRDGFVTTDVITLSGGGPSDSPAPTLRAVKLGLVRRAPTPFVDVLVPIVLLPLVAACIAGLALDRRRHVGGALRHVNRI